MSRTEDALRRAMVAASRELVAAGLTQGTSGNIAARLGAEMLVTPSGIAPAALAPEMISAMPLDDAETGDGAAWRGPLPPSSEWRLHRAVLAARPEAAAVVHTHSPHATALAMARRPIPACHYMVALFGGEDVRVSGYETFGSEALARAAVAALDGRSSCLLANHGAVVVAEDLARAMWLAAELEALARQYLLSLAAGGPVLLGESEMADARAAFAGYGPRRREE
jgi:L-fuculose-phosphate aldolase